MSQFLLSVQMVQGVEPLSPATKEQMYADVRGFNAKLQAAGALVFAGGLHSPDLASVVCVEDGKIVRSGRPFAEGKEHLGGLWIIEANDFAAALDWAEQATRAYRGPVEVRPFQDAPKL